MKSSFGRLATSLVLGSLLIGSVHSHAEIVEEIVAWVDGDIITRSDLEAAEQALVATLYREYTGAELDRRVQEQRAGVLAWIKSGEPMIWVNGAAVSISMIAVIGLLILLMVRGFGHFWPADIMQARLIYQGSERAVMGEIVESEQVSGEQLSAAGISLDGPGPFYQRNLVKQGNRDILGSDFVWLLQEQLHDMHWPETAMVVERLEWGNLYAHLVSVSKDGEELANADLDDEAAWTSFQQVIAETSALRDQIHQIERVDIGRINYRMEQLRLEQRRLELRDRATPEALALMEEERAELDAQYRVLQGRLSELYQEADRYSYSVRLADERLAAREAGS